MADEQTPVESSIDLMARYMLWQLVDVERVRWENYPELGEHDFERIIERIEQIAPPCPDMHERQAAYEFLSNRADEHERTDSGTA